MKSFQTQTFGKWILAGEHSVLRGSPALVFPLFSRSLNFSYQPGIEPLKFSLSGNYGKELELLVRNVIDQALKLKSQKMDLSGFLSLSSDIPLGAGLGASAALCVAVTRWMQDLGMVSREEGIEFARQLENIFHGESSGVDVAVVSSEKSLRFVKGQAIEYFQPRWKPNLYISYCGQKGVTSQCVAQVKTLIEQNPQLGSQLDQEMKLAVEMALESLMLSEEKGLELLTTALQKAESCFVGWSLTSGLVESHLASLKKSGALAVKPTGSGGGGFILSLWKEKPSAEIQAAQNLLSCF